MVVERNSQRVLWFNDAATSLLGLRYPRDIDAPLGERLQPLPLAHWLAAGRNAEPLLDAASPVDPDAAPEPAPDPLLATTCGCWSRATSAS